MAVDLLGPASDNAVTSRPARTISRGSADTWFKDCSDPDANDGTSFPADYFNDTLAQVRTALRSSAIALDGGDDMLWRAMQSIGVRYGADTGAANAITVAFTPLVPALVPGLMLLIKLAADITGASTVKADGTDATNLKWPDGTALALGDAKAGALLLVAYDGVQFQLLCRMNGGGAAAATFVPGTIHMWPTEAAPTGTLECDGSAVSRTTYARLFGIIGSMYGAGNGTTTFNLPDYRGMSMRGMNHGAGVDPDAGSRTNRGDGTTGDHVGTKQAQGVGPFSFTGPVEIDNLVSTANNAILQGASGSFTGGGSASPVADATGLTGTMTFSKTTGETRPINVSVLFVIAF